MPVTEEPKITDDTSFFISVSPSWATKLRKTFTPAKGSEWKRLQNGWGFVPQTIQVGCHDVMVSERRFKIPCSNFTRLPEN